MFNMLKSEESCTKCCLSSEDRLQLERSKQIDRELAAFKRHYRATQKIVLLGAGESGKSTFLKQMQIIHGNGFSHEETILYRTQIYENILRGMAGLVNGKKELKLPWRGSFSSLDKISKVNESVNGATEIALHMKQILSKFTVVYKRLMEERERESQRLNKRINIAPEQFAGVIEFIIELWNEHSIREAYDRRREFPKYFVENVPYFINNFERIKRLDYMPNSADILRSRRATTTINEIEMEIKTVPFRFVDVGGQRTQRQKWHQCFSDVTAILFLASSSEYDEFLREDCQTNRLEESCKVFETLVNYKYLRTVEFILFLNKHDLLREKIDKINIKNYCSDFKGEATSLQDVEDYLIKKFSSLKRDVDDILNNTAENSNNYRSENEVQTLNQRKRYRSAKAKPSADFDTIQPDNSFIPRSKYYDNSTNARLSNEKSIYTHFTTAIDTNNIKTIFEMVRLMIFENNCKAIMLN